MKKALFISSRPIFPIIGGDQIRTAQQLEFLQKKYIVDVLYITDIKEEGDAKNYMQDVRNIFSFYVPKKLAYLQTLRFLLNKLPLQVNYYFNSSVNKWIKSHFTEYDMIFCNNIRTAEYVIHLNGVKKCIDFVDAISMNYEKAKTQSHGFKKLIYSIDYKRCIRYEQMVLSNFDKYAIISEIDKQYILSWQQKLMLSGIK